MHHVNALCVLAFAAYVDTIIIQIAMLSCLLAFILRQYIELLYPHPPLFFIGHIKLIICIKTDRHFV